jgi:hypothetical protein
MPSCDIITMLYFDLSPKKQDKEVAACGHAQMESEASMLGSERCNTQGDAAAAAGDFDMPVISLYPRAFVHQSNRSVRGEQQQQQHSCVASFTIGDEEEHDSPSCLQSIRCNDSREFADGTVSAAGSNG